ncbi:uncharacterized protein LOC62_02G002053 [Vanrija pseudolonga]|uniref:DNA lyase n=1 Tax=Vanrija pseudolonga TaxID=143232 RepID=A0AAF1BFS1_9TREE|nr:hypothetical protein LOC62_02G002053 [Vanrija pseudolonga]
MRLWSLDPALLDRAALIACWREGLLAQKVLAGLTKGYTKHPQLERFRKTPDPPAAIGHFLESLYLEAVARGYNFDVARITVRGRPVPHIPLHQGQLEYEHDWLVTKVRKRQPDWLDVLEGAPPRAARSFAVVPGGVESWERVQEVAAKKSEKGASEAKVGRVKAAPAAKRPRPQDLLLQPDVPRRVTRARVKLESA